MNETPPSPQDFRIKSTCRYPRRYALRDFDAQVATLRKWWPAIDPDSAWRYYRTLTATDLPQHAEGFFVLMSAGFFRSRETGVREVMAALREQRRGHFRSYLDGKFDVAHLRLRSRTLESYQQVLIQQGGDLLVVPAQFGAQQRGKTYVRHPHQREFNLDMLGVGCMLLAHPLRFVHDTDLHANCGGERLAKRIGGDFDDTPYFQFERGKLRLDSFSTDISFPHDGAVTAFVI